MPTTKLKKPLTWLYPLGFERQYQRVLVRVVRQWQNMARDIILPALPSIVASANNFTNPTASNIKSDYKKTYTAKKDLRIGQLVGYDEIRSDDWVDETEETMKSYEFALIVITPFLLRAIEQVAMNVQVFNNRQWKKIIKHSLNIDLFSQEPWLAAHIKSFIDENVSLIIKLQQETTADIFGIITRGVKEGKTFQTISKEIMKGTPTKSGRFKKTKNRALLIGRDQINKLNGQLQRIRQTDFGVTKYIWETRRDERVRRKHVAMDRKTCSWHDSTVYFTSDGEKRSRESINGTLAHVGQDPNCRCNSQPDFTGFEVFSST